MAEEKQLDVVGQNQGEYPFQENLEQFLEQSQAEIMSALVQIGDAVCQTGIQGLEIVQAGTSWFLSRVSEAFERRHIVEHRYIFEHHLIVEHRVTFFDAIPHQLMPPNHMQQPEDLPNNEGLPHDEGNDDNNEDSVNVGPNSTMA